MSSPILLIPAVILLIPLHFIATVVAAATNTAVSTAFSVAAPPAARKWILLNIIRLQKYKEQNKTKIATLQKITNIGFAKTSAAKRGFEDMSTFVAKKNHHKHGHEEQKRTLAIMKRKAKTKQFD